MLEIRVLLSDVDYDTACEKIAPILADKMQELYREREDQLMLLGKHFF